MLLARDRAAASDLINAYGRAWQRISLELARVNQAITARRDAGEQVSASWLLQQERYRSLQAQAETEISKFAEFADQKTRQEQAAAVQSAQEHAEALSRLALGEPPTGVYVQWNRLPARALEQMVGFFSDGSPLREHFDRLAAGTAAKVRNVLTGGLAAGLNPRVTASALKETLGGNLVSAMRTARTETLRSYREASLESYRQNEDLVEGWVWVASLSGRTCAMCIAMHGTFHPAAETFGSHVCCRCTPVPHTKGWEEILGRKTGIRETRPVVESGEGWFRRQNQDVQEEILGPGKLAAYRQGHVTLADLVGFREDPRWGPVRWERNIQDGAGAAVKRERRLAHTLETVERGIRNTDLEHGAIVSPEGDVLAEYVGQRTRIRTPEQYRPLLPGNISIHSHPYTQAFSDEDLRFAGENRVAELRVVDNQHRHSIKPPAGGWWSSEEFAKRVAPRYAELVEEFLPEQRAAARRRDIDPFEANKRVIHQVLERLSGELGFVYERVSWPPGKS